MSRSQTPAWPLQARVHSIAREIVQVNHLLSKILYGSPHQQSKTPNPQCSWQSPLQHLLTPPTFPDSTPLPPRSSLYPHRPHYLVPEYPILNHISRPLSELAPPCLARIPLLLPEGYILQHPVPKSSSMKPSSHPRRRVQWYPLCSPNPWSDL